MAPEVASGTDYEAAADVFSFGMLLWEIFRLEVPFRDVSPSEVSKLLGAGHRPQIVPDEFPPEFPEDLITLMTDCWANDPDQRPEFEFIVETLDEFLPRPNLCGLTVDDEDFVENAWWKASPPGGAGLLPAARHESEVVEFDAGVHEVDQVIWARSLTPLDPRTDACSSVGDEDDFESAWWKSQAPPTRPHARLPARTDPYCSPSSDESEDAHVLYGS
mmetsp:Transcript_51400/g.133731  ORF Transcript_51400/g.133731 Transcript_51400/m.133731 type:complete len:218 (+) Transcript_51400:2-655(+)